MDTSDAANDEISDDEFDALLDQLPGLRGGDMKSQETVEAAHATHDQTRSDKELGDLLRNVADPPQASVIPASPQPAEGAADTVMPTDHQEKKQRAVALASAHPAEVADSTIRVDTKGLDDIMNMVGELVLARNRLSTLDADLGNEHLTQAVNNLSLVASDLQTLVMKTRMQPIKKAFGRFPRVVRDLARILNKEVLLEMEGEDTALDKTLVDALADPLVHLVRNSVDHGIEMPAQRAAAGKPRCGRVRLMASQKGDHIQVGVADDGVGLDAEKLRKKALDKGLISVEAAARMSREECFNLIFMPGFTTMDVASNVSGRGVGMDVVKTRIGQFNGSVSIESELGAGTVIYIKVPLTLAIMPTLMVKVAGHIFAIPLLSILEILEYDETRTKRVDGQKVFILQDKVVPVYSLRDWLTTNSLAPPSQQAHLVLVSLGSARYGLIVDDLVGQEEVVIKPLGKLLHGTPGLVGATITGDGEIALILDILGLITHYASLSNIQVA
ncbi:MAG TPA: chemotaxis protein CheA [Gammaproteobacteria bacterium]|nr:chemotaxis protein CheA [Gammaproteobacteria bacterium]